MNYALVSVPAAAVRRKPNHRREMVSQLLFGEAVRVIREKGELWVKVRSLHDNYEGWMTNTLLQEVSKEEANQYCEYVTSGLINTIQLNKIDTQIPWGASLPSFDKGKGRVGKHNYSFNGSFIKREEQIPGEELLKKLAMPWLNAPYQWGGRSLFGVDCSGFTQTVFKFLHIPLLRDAYQQATQGEAVGFLEETKTGDLAFFDNEEGKITHVGILLSANEIIHASVKVRIDKIDNMGIVRSDNFQRTHHLRIIKRLLPAS